jgi:hypothetical protein
MRSLKLLTGFALLLASGVPVASQERCPDGRTLSGQCVNPVLARVMRKQTIISTQPKFSYTAPLYLPNEERFYTSGRDHHEISHFFGGPVRLGGTIVP